MEDQISAWMYLIFFLGFIFYLISQGSTKSTKNTSGFLNQDPGPYQPLPQGHSKKKSKKTRQQFSWTPVMDFEQDDLDKGIFQGPGESASENEEQIDQTSKKTHGGLYSALSKKPKPVSFIVFHEILSPPKSHRKRF